MSTIYYGKDRAGNPVYESSSPNTPATPTPPSGGGAVVAAPYSTSPAQTAALTGTAAADAITSSSGTARAVDNKAGVSITAASDPSYISPTSNYDAIMGPEIDRLNSRFQQEQASIQASYDALKTSTGDQQNRETGATSTMLARAGGYLGVSGSGTGVLLNLAQGHRNEMSALESKRLSSLNEARSAYEDKNFELAKLKYADAKATEQTGYERRQTYLKQVSDANAAAAVTEKKRQTQVDIYNAIAGGTTDPMEIFQKLGGTTSIDDINSFLKGVTPKDATGGFAYTTAQTAKLLGSGLSEPDIKAAQDYINTKGYTEEFRAQLSPAQKVAFDAVYREKAVAAKVAGSTGLSVDFVPSKISSIVSQYGISKVFEDLLSPSVPTWFYPVIQELAANHYTDIGMGAPSSLSPESDIAKNIWQQFKSTSDMSMFVQQVTKKITGSSGATATGAGASFGALNSSLPAPVEG